MCARFVSSRGVRKTGCRYYSDCRRTLLTQTDRIGNTNRKLLIAAQRALRLTADTCPGRRPASVS
jgi:hypothetical protein